MVIRTVTYILGLITLSACAKVVAPSGGEKDINPPEVIHAHPPNNSTLFNSQEIVLEFDEFIILKDLNKQLIVSPPLKYKLQSKVKGKKLILTLQDTLIENTTYVLNFGNAIVDLNEANAIKNYQYVFSTGTKLDSIKIDGKVMDAFSKSVEEDFYVMLYSNFNADSTAAVHLPTYLTKSNKEGNFTITNIKEGTYKLVVLKDGNNNFLYDRTTEKVGFITDSFNLNKNRSGFIIPTFLPANNRQFIVNHKAEFSTLSLTFQNEPTKFSYTLLDNELNLKLLELEKNERIIKLWWEEFTAKKLKLAVADVNFNDTIKFDLDSFPNSKVLKLRSTFVAPTNYYEPINLYFDTPLKSLDSSNVLIYSPDSSQLPFQLKLSNSDNKLALLSFKFNALSTYRMQILPAAFTDIYGNTTDTISTSITFNEAQNFGTLKVTLQSNSTSPKIIQLTNAKGDVITEQKIQQNSANFENIQPGDYRLKLVFDENNNGRWDTGNYFENRQPENTFLYDENIVIRENWDKEITWIIQ